MNKYLIVGLGNIGREYEHTRHNIGFDICDEYVREHGATEYKLERLAMITTIKVKSRPVVVIKPTTYMNLSGNAVRYYLQKEKVNLENLLVVVDDLSLPIAKMRFRPSGSPGGHNGLKDIELKLNTNKYPRLRVGVGDDFPKGRQVDYVLGKWNKNELDILNNNKQNFIDAIDTFVFNGINDAMNKFNC